MNLKEKRPSNITKHGIISGLYFNSILNNIIDLFYTKKNLKVLDFGCGYGYLKKKLIKNTKIKIINFDIIKRLTDMSDWKKVKFDYLVSTHVFMYLKKKELEKLLIDLKKHNNKLLLIVTISKQGLLNDIGKFILNEKNAHTGTCLQPLNELNILKKKMNIIKKINVFFLSDIYLLRFKKNKK